MILELKIKNFLSFKEEVTFSFEAKKDRILEDYQVVEIAPGIRILRLAVIYGANASGKSNLLVAFEFLRTFLLNEPKNKDESTHVIPFLLNSKTPEETSEFSLVFYIGEIKHVYTLILNRQRVELERLSVYTTNQPTEIFNRVIKDGISDITFNAKKVKISQVVKEEINIKCLANMSVFAAYNKVNVSIAEMDNILKWIKQKFKGVLEQGLDHKKFTEREIINNVSVKESILDFLKQADYNIVGVDISEKPVQLSEKILSSLSDNVRELFIKQKNRRVQFEHRILNDDGESETYNLSKGLESKGTLQTFGLAGVICKTIEANAFLTIDEIESSLHPLLVNFIIEDFLKRKGQSQMLITTHYDGLLDEEDLLRKDSIWFTEKKKNGATELYSLVDFNGINRLSSLRKAYKYGKFGAIPKI